MEDKLESYRLRKRRLEKINQIKDKFFKMLTTTSDTTVKIEVRKLLISI